MKLRVLYVITKAEVGGAQSHLLELIRGLRDEFDIHLATGQSGFLVREARALSVPVTVLRNLVHPIHPVKDVAALLELAQLVAKVRPTLVHAHSSKAGIVARLVASKFGVKSVFTAHGWAFAEGVPWKRKVLAVGTEALAARFTSKIIVVSERDGYLAVRYRVARPDQLVVIHNGIRDVMYRADPASRLPVRVIMVARFAPPKAHDQLLQALASMNDLPWVLWLVGDGPTRPFVEERARQLGIEDRVVFLGERKDVAQLLAQCHIFALTSNWEGLPLTIIEAMRAGLPVVASEVGGVSEAVVDGETGFVIPRGRVDILQDRLLRLLESPELRVQMGLFGRARYEQYFTVERMLAETRRVYEEVLVARH